MKKWLSSLLMIVILLAGVNFTFAQEKRPKLIRIGYPGAGYQKIYAAGIPGIIQDRGLLEEEFKNDGINFKWYFFKDAGPGVNEAVANGTLDVFYEGDLPSLVGKAGGLKVKLLAASSVRGNVYICVPADSPYSSIEDLKGKTIAIHKGINAHLTFDRILDANGLSEKDFNLINLASTEAQAALASKEVDAALGSFFTLREQGLARIIYSTNDKPDNWKPASALLVTEEFADKYPDIVKRIVKVHVKAAKWGSEEERREEVFKLWAKMGTHYKQVVETNAGKPMKLINTPVIDEFFIHHYKDALIFAKEQGLIRKTFDIDKWIDKSYLEAALKELGLENHWPYFDKDGEERRIRQ
jgi:sulfonate transport system substrate-binding protein